MDNKIHLEGTPVFYQNLNSTAKIIVNRGGAGSGKSYSTLQLLVYKLMTEEKKSIVILRKTLPALRHSTYEAFLGLLDDMKVYGMLAESKQFLTYRYGNSVIRFGSVDNAEKIKSTEFNYIFLEEATDFSYQDYQMIKLRLRAPSIDGKKNQMFLCFNPVDETHWIKTKLLESEPDCQEIVSTYKDNPFIPEDYREMLEELVNQDRNYYRVYALGEWGRLEGLIYTGNYKVVDEVPNAKEHQPFYGLDFGFNDPCALVELIPTKNTNELRELGVRELIYKSELTTEELITQMEKVIPKEFRHRPVYCDSAEPDRIKAIRQAGFNAKPAKKGKSIIDGIDFVKTCFLFIIKGSDNVIKEFQSYSWKQDKNGVTLDIPIDINNHTLDAIRYAIITHLKKADFKFRWLNPRS